MTGDRATSAGAAWRWFGNMALGLSVLLGGFVFREPAPYELYLAALIVAWVICGLQLPRTLATPLALLALFCIGGALSITQATAIDDEPVYVAVTAFLALSSVFFAAVIARRPERLRLIANAWILAAALTTALGILGYVGLTPDGLFTRYGRAAGGFEDPNVFGPFLILPYGVLIHRALAGPARVAFVSTALALLLAAGILLSFSRGAWALAAFVTLGVIALLVVTEPSFGRKARYLLATGVLGGLGILVLAGLASLEGVGDLLGDRARLFQDYDAGEGGRFDRQLVGIRLALDHPFGIGALEFGKLYGEDPHNIWIKALMAYGWIGFLAFLALTLATLACAFPLIFKRTPLQPLVQVTYVAYLGHMLAATVIDVDHWRHVFLIIGMLWGMIAAQPSCGRRTRTRPSSYPELRIAY